MDVYEATRVVLSRIQSLDPANASKIMGLLLLQDHGEKEMIRLAFGPQSLLHSVIAKAKKELDFLGCSKPQAQAQAHLELLRSKSVPPRLAHQLTGGSRFPFSPKQSSEAQRATGVMMMMMGDDSGRWRPERIDLSAMACPASRQIYLTFPADSIFREEDVSNYFSTYGPVQDVRIPYQQKRMFGFVTFVFPETVKSILAKGNPHFVCDSRVLVKPYKEKGKVPDKYRTKPSPDALDCRDIMDLQLGVGGRVFHDNNQDLLWRRRFEERALELQSTRLMNLHLLDVDKHFPRLVSAKENEKGSGWEGSEEDTIKLPGSLEDRLPDSPFASPKHRFLEFAAAADTNGSASSSPSFDTEESTTSALPDSFKSFNCQMPSLAVMGMLPGNGGPTCRVGI